MNQYNDNNQKHGFNDKPHGYWESYYSNGAIMYKGKYFNGKPYGYWERFEYFGKLKSKTYYI